jgi:branched-chain amino acid transport system permease protein
MDAEIIAMLGQDGVTNGAIALLALALVLVFAVTRVIFIPQGEFLAWALTMAALEAGHFPPRCGCWSAAAC